MSGNETQKKSNLKLLLSVVVFIAAMLLAGPVSGSLDKLTGAVSVIHFNWLIPFRLIMLVSGILIVSEVVNLILKHCSPKTGHGRTAMTLARSAVRYVLALVGIFWCLSILGVEVGALLAGAGVVALIIGFGAESLIADVITGIFMLFEHQYEVGDIIEVGQFRGTVTQIGIRTTSVTDAGGNTKIINNSDVRDLINRSSDKSCAVCDIAIPYRGYLRKAEKLLEETLPGIREEHSGLFLSEPQYLGVQQMDLNSDAVLLRVAADVREGDIYRAQRTLNRDLLLAFEDAGIPNPVNELKVVRE